MISPWIYDAWLVTPPCEYDPYICNHECPHFHNDCWGGDFDEEDDEELPELYY